MREEQPDPLGRGERIFGVTLTTGLPLLDVALLELVRRRDVFDRLVFDSYTNFERPRILHQLWNERADVVPCAAPSRGPIGRLAMIFASDVLHRGPLQPLWQRYGSCFRRHLCAPVDCEDRSPFVCKTDERRESPYDDDDYQQPEPEWPFGKRSSTKEHDSW